MSLRYAKIIKYSVSVKYLMSLYKVQNICKILKPLKNSSLSTVGFYKRQNKFHIFLLQEGRLRPVIIKYKHTSIWWCKKFNVWCMGPSHNPLTPKGSIWRALPCTSQTACTGGWVFLVHHHLGGSSKVLVSKIPESLLQLGYIFINSFSKAVFWASGPATWCYPLNFSPCHRQLGLLL